MDPNTLDTDSDGIPDVDDADDDGDGVIDSLDPWPLDDYYSADYDKDGMPDTTLISTVWMLQVMIQLLMQIQMELTNLEEFTYKTDPQNHDTGLRFNHRWGRDTV